jgi:cold shock CspA family protein/ribosome-associated translation inhibitor RaiA
MQTPIEIDFQGLKGNEHLRACVLKHVAVLEERFGRITACRVVIRAPSERHRTGGAYEIAIRLSLPQGREVDIRRSETADERHADPTFALNDAFKRARRRLRDQARRMQGHVKAHDGPPIATVSKFDDVTGFGFLETADGREVYFHKNAVLNGGARHIAPGVRVTYFEEMGDKGAQASTVKVLGKHGLKHSVR